MNNYNNVITRYIFEKFAPQLKEAPPGHCMKLTGLSNEVLHGLRTAIAAEVAHLDCRILSVDQSSETYITATKLIELRNLEESPLLVLVPSNLRTAAGDSFGNPTFQDLNVGSVERELVVQLKSEAPVEYRNELSEILNFLRLPAEDASREIRYLCEVAEAGYSRASWGTALYHLGLLPDARLLENPATIKARLDFNQGVVGQLADFGTPLHDRIRNLPLPPHTLQKPLGRFFKDNPGLRSQDAIVFTIARRYPKLHFNHWKISELEKPEVLELEVLDFRTTNLKYDDDGVAHIECAEGQSVRTKLKFTTRPIPHTAPDLDRFRVDLMRINSAHEFETVFTLLEFRNTASKRSYRTKDILLDSNLIDAGHYFLRIKALNQHGAVMNRRDPYQDPVLQKAWEEELEREGDAAKRDDFRGKLRSDTFNFMFFTKEIEEGALDSAAELRPQTGVASVVQAWMKVELDAMRHQEPAVDITRDESDWRWVQAGKKGAKKIFHARFLRDRHKYQIEVSNKLLRIQEAILKHPEQMASIAVQVTTGAWLEEEAISYLRPIPSEMVPEPFLAARKALFEAIRNDLPEGNGIVETFEWQKHLALTRTYLREYHDWLAGISERLKEFATEAPGEKKTLQKLLSTLQNLDIVKVEAVLPNRDPFSFYLMSPVHPLRLTWFVQHTEWFQELAAETREDWQHLKHWTEPLEQLVTQKLQPSNTPLVLGAPESVDSYLYTGELTYGWGLYLRSRWGQRAVSPLDSRSELLMNYVGQLLQVEGRMEVSSNGHASAIQRYMRNYVRQHPYAKTLIVNLFNAGTARSFVEALVGLEREREFKSLRYEIRLYTHADHIVDNGAALKSLLNPKYNLSEEAEAFSQATRNHLFPKIRFSINHIQTYLEDTAAAESHLSFMFSPFALHTASYLPREKGKSFFMDGLMVVPRVEVSGGEEGAARTWNRYILPGYDDTDQGPGTLGGRIFNHFQQLVNANLLDRPEATLPATKLMVRDRDVVLLDKVHQYSDWVVTFDSNLGPEIYDVPGKSGSIPFLLDFVPGENWEDVSAFLTTRMHDELHFQVVPFFAGQEMSVHGEAAAVAALVEEIRSVSSSLILRLAAGDAQVAEGVSIGLTKRMLGRLGLLQDRFLIPIDLHERLFRSADLPNGQSQSRADLLLVGLEPERKAIVVQIVELKWRNQVENEAGLLKKMQTQMDNTASVLANHFDPDLRLPDRIDRMVKCKELYELLSYYLRRALRYRAIDPTTAENGLEFLCRLEEGYSIRFEQVGFVFSPGAPHGVVKQEHGENLTFFHLGDKAIYQLLQPEGGEEALSNEIVETIVQSEMTNRIAKRFELKRKPKAVIAEDKKSTVASPVKVDLPKEENAVSSEIAALPEFDLFIGDHSPSGQYGVIGKIAGNGKRVALDLNGVNTLSLFGIQGAGKSYSIGIIAEMILQQFQGINILPKPLAGVIFHYSTSEDYKPEFTSMRYPNDEAGQLAKLKSEYDAEPEHISKVTLLVPKAKVDERKLEYPDLNVIPLTFNSAELGIKEWKYLMGATGNQALYMKQINNLMRQMRGRMTLDELKEKITSTSLLNSGQKELAGIRLALAEEFIDDTTLLGDVLEPGKLVIVDLRDELIEQDDALGLFVIMLNIFANAKRSKAESFNKFIVFDEAHKYMGNKDLTGNIVSAIREMRHKGVTLMIASQDPPSLPNEIIELSSVLLMHRFNSPNWLKHIQKSITQISNLDASNLANLGTGEAFMWTSKSDYKLATQQAVKLQLRPRVTRHGGGTILASDHTGEEATS